MLLTIVTKGSLRVTDGTFHSLHNLIFIRWDIVCIHYIGCQFTFPRFICDERGVYFMLQTGMSSEKDGWVFSLMDDAAPIFFNNVYVYYCTPMLPDTLLISTIARRCPCLIINQNPPLRVRIWWIWVRVWSRIPKRSSVPLPAIPVSMYPVGFPYPCQSLEITKYLCPICSPNPSPSPRIGPNPLPSPRIGNTEQTWNLWGLLK